MIVACLLLLLSAVSATAHQVTLNQAFTIPSGRTLTKRYTCPNTAGIQGRRIGEGQASWSSTFRTSGVTVTHEGPIPNGWKAELRNHSPLAVALHIQVTCEYVRPPLRRGYDVIDALLDEALAQEED